MSEEEKIVWLNKMIQLANKESSDISWGEREMRLGARMGCDCGCGGDSLTEEDFEHDRDETQYEVLLKLKDNLRGVIYYHSQWQEETTKEELLETIKLFNEEIEEAMKNGNT
jgi:hypothetical protein